MTVKYNVSPEQKWIVFGGSYAGALSIWTAQLYAHLVAGVVGSSGPIYLEVDFKRNLFCFFFIVKKKLIFIFVLRYTEYLEGISRPIQIYSPQCANAVQQAFTELSEKLQTYEGQELVTKHFQYVWMKPRSHTHVIICK